MATLKPFKAWRPNPEFVKEVACVPYDVVNTEEASGLAEGKPNSFLHVIRPEIDLPQETDIHANEVYERGKENLRKLLNSEAYFQELEDAIYIYHLEWKGKSQTGIYVCVSVKDYDHEIILKHELTRPDKEDDRTRHILTMEAHPEPVMMTFEDSAGVTSLINEVTQQKPLYQFEADDEVTHTIWKVQNPQALILAFTDIPKIYIADGHHRCASASRAAHEMESHNPEHSGKEEYNFFPAVLFPKDEMQILSYNRIIFKVPDNFISELENAVTVKRNVNPTPTNKGDVSVYIDGNWYGFTLPSSQKNDPASKLDVARLQEYILDPLLGITDQRTDTNISFIGGKRGTQELERLVNSGSAAMAISLYPTSINELIDVSDAGLLMPPKSTWFEPKLRSGLLIHTF